MKKHHIILLYCLSTLFTVLSVSAQSDQLSEEKTKCIEMSRSQFSNAAVYTPYQARQVLKARIEYTNEVRKNPLEMLSNSFHYTPEELKKITEMLKDNENQIFLDRIDAKVVEQMISDDVAGAFAEIVCSERLNPIYLPSDTQDEQPLLKDFKSENLNMNQLKSMDNTQSVEIIPSIQSGQIQSSRKKQLGKKSYNLNPDNFIYEENQ